MGTQGSSRKDGFGTEGIGENGDGTKGTTNSGVGGTGATSGGGNQRGAHKTEGAFGKEDGSTGRANQGNKQGLEGTGADQQD